MGREHIRNLIGAAGVTIVVVADAVLDAATSAAASIGAEATNAPLDAIRRDDLDAVVIASPDDTHADFAVAAIEAGLMVLCEKPLAHDLAGAGRVLAAEMAAGRRLLQTGFMRVYDEAHLQVAEALGSLGMVRMLRCFHRNANGAWLRSVDAVLTQSLIHDVHTIRWLTGSEVERVTTHVVEREGGVEVIHLVAEMANGSVATVDFDDIASDYDVGVEAFAIGGTVFSSPQLRATVHSGGVASRRVGTDWFARFTEAYRLEAHAWADSVATGTAVGPSTWDGFAAQSVIEAATRSVTSGEAASVMMPMRPSMYDDTPMHVAGE